MAREFCSVCGYFVSVIGGEVARCRQDFGSEYEEYIDDDTCPYGGTEYYMHEESVFDDDYDEQDQYDTFPELD